ncbi:MAG: HAD-IA family hydrolase [Clostridiales bacterium]|nr:HAD-IA family hydrolase [Clostridiales bacterium]
MVPEYKAVLFDVDGTLLDTSEGILVSIRETIEHFGYEMLPQSELLKFIGPPIEWSFRDRLGLTGEAITEAAMYFRDRYSNHNLLLAKPYEGIPELLDFLKQKDIPVAIATYKKDDYAKKLLLHFGFGDYTDIIYGSDYEGKLRKCDIIELCIERLGISDRKKVLMVGDSKHDAEGAAKAGTSFAGVSFGFGFGDFGGEDINDYEHVIYVDNAIELRSLFN